MNAAARAAGRELADEAGPIADPSVVARVAALIHAATCTTPSATNGRSGRAASVNIDPGGQSSRVHQSR